MSLPKTGKKFRSMIGPLTFDYYVQKGIDGRFTIARTDDACATVDDVVEVTQRLNQLGVGYHIPPADDKKLKAVVAFCTATDFMEGGDA